jgi:hypothetical protein
MEAMTPAIAATIIAPAMTAIIAPLDMHMHVIWYVI